MSKHSIAGGALMALAAGAALARSSASTIEALQASAKAYAGTDWREPTPGCASRR